MFIFLGKLIFSFIIFIGAVKLLGKSALAQLTPHDFGAIIFLSYLAFAPIKVEGWMQGVIGIAVITFVHLLIQRLNLINRFNHLIIGHPTILIKHGKIIYKNLKKSRFSLSELLSSLRTAGFPDIKDIEYTILEPNGEISILPKKDLVPLTPKDLNMNVEYEGLPIAVVIEGKIQKKNLKLIKKSEPWLRKELKTKGYHQIKDIFYASIRDTDYSLTVHSKDNIDDQI